MAEPMNNMPEYSKGLPKGFTADYGGTRKYGSPVPDVASMQAEERASLTPGQMPQDMSPKLSSGNGTPTGDLASPGNRNNQGNAMRW